MEVQLYPIQIRYGRWKLTSCWKSTQFIKTSSDIKILQIKRDYLKKKKRTDLANA